MTDPVRVLRAVLLVAFAAWSAFACVSYADNGGTTELVATPFVLLVVGLPNAAGIPIDVAVRRRRPGASGWWLVLRAGVVLAQAAWAWWVPTLLLALAGLNDVGPGALTVAAVYLPALLVLAGGWWAADALARG